MSGALRTLGLAASVAALLLASHAVLAQPSVIVLDVLDAPRLHVGEVGAVELRLRLDPGDEQPLLLTPFVQGAAVEVVRGRLLRDDALRPSPGELRFRVPIAARTLGTALLRVELWTYRCSSGCESVRVYASATLHVVAGS